MANKQLLLKIANEIEKKPERYNQNEWLTRVVYDNHCATSAFNVEAVRAGKFTCGSKGCVAGHAIVMSKIDLAPYTPDFYGGMNPDVNINAAATAALDISHALAGWLFSGGRREPAMPAILRLIASGVEDLGLLTHIEAQLYTYMRSVA